MPKISGALAYYPARISFAAYSILVLIGAAALWHPISSANPASPITWVEAMFTSVSACCVTGLGVRSTGHDFSFIGQIFILILIQIGGIGILTITNYLLLQIGGTARMRERQVLSQTLGALGNDNLGWVLLNVFRFSLIVEGIGVLLLTLRFSFEMPFLAAVWHALFHSVSAFCNAGFSLNDSSLIDYQGDLIVNLTICGLIVAGGIGFPVILDLMRHHRGTTWIERARNLQLHTKMILVGTVVLILGGAISIFFIEYNHALRDQPWSSKILVPIFQSITCRTAGFNTVDQASLTSASLYLSICLMLIGGGPCSTAGGVKVTSIYMIFLKAWSRLRGNLTVTIFRRTIPQSSLDKASTVVLFYFFIAALALMLVLLLEQGFGSIARDEQMFLPALFEVISALGTVGLSVNLTSSLSDPTLFVLMMLMFLGRLGPVSVFAALSMPGREKPLQFVSEEPLVG